MSPVDKVVYGKKSSIRLQYPFGIAGVITTLFFKRMLKKILLRAGLGKQNVIFRKMQGFEQSYFEQGSQPIRVL